MFPSWPVPGLLSSGPGSALPWGITALALAGAVWAGVLAGRSARARRRLEEQLEALGAGLEKSERTLHEALAALENENFTDPLTELRNRRYITAVVKADIAKVQRVYRDEGPGPLANQDLVFFMVDLDHFSRFNDFYGQPMGDQVLCLVAQALRRAVRESDAVIRWGGEEFLVVARSTTRRESARIAERIRKSVAELSVDSPKGETLRWTCSVGFAPYPFQPSDFSWLGWERIVEITEACLEVAKRSGRNTWVGVQAGNGLERARHGPRFPRELGVLVDEGVLEVLSSREDPFGRTRKTGEILG